MKAAVLHSPGRVLDRPLRVQQAAKPEAGAGQLLLRVLACGVCRTDLHIVEGELPPRREPLIPGHQIVGEVVRWRNPELASGDARRRLLDRRNRRHLLVLPAQHGEPLRRGHVHRLQRQRRLCGVRPRPRGLRLSTAGGAGRPSRRAAAVRRHHRLPQPARRRCGARRTRRPVRLRRLGASCHRSAARAWGCEVYVSTRGESHRKLAESLGAKWVGAEVERPPVRTRPRRDLRAQRRRGCRRALQPAQRRRGGHQRHSPRPHSRV